MSNQSEQGSDNTQELNRLHELLIARLKTKKRMIKPYDERFIIGYQTKKKGDDTDWGYLDEEIMRHVKRFINDWHNKQVEQAAREARIDELNSLPHRSVTALTSSVDQSVIYERIAELKAQQEEV